MAAFNAGEAVREAERDYNAALREYETTPEGQESLQQAISQLHADGDEEARDRARVRLVEAERTREHQVAELAASRAQKARRLEPTAEEAAALDDVHNDVEDALQAVEAAELAQKNAWDAYASADAADVAARHQDQAARSAVDAAAARTVEAQNECRYAAQELYQQCGVNPRMALLYADDCLANSFGPGGIASRPFKVKTKRNGPDVDATQRAKALSETDPEFRAKARRLDGAITEYRQAIRDQDQLRQSSTDAVHEARHQAHQRYRTTGYAVEDAHTKLEKAERRAAGMRAKVGAGAGVESHSVPMRDAADQIVRNPDGSVNAWVWREASDGFPDGRYVRVVGVTTTTEQGSRSNALVLENGEVTHQHTHLGRHGGVWRATEQVSGDRQVLVAPPVAGGHLLRTEGDPTLGFASYVDTTD